MLNDWHQVLGFFQAYLPLRRAAGCAADPLVHGVHARPGKVRLGVGQPLLIVRAASLAQGKESFAFQLRDVQSFLPRRSGLDKKLSQHPG